MSQINIGNLTIDKFYLGNSDDVKIYLGDTLLYPQSTPPTPVSSCYEIIPQPISQYASTTYDSVYSWSDAKWYMKNNLSQYEEYGIYDIVENISSATTYNGKLAVVGTTEYQYSGGSWSVVGSYVDSSVTYTIDDTNPSPYVGQELSTTFKIPYADVESIGWVDLRIRDNDGGNLSVGLDTGGMAEYRYMGSSDSYEGTVTNDGEYFYLSLPSEAPQSIVINSINYWRSTPIHLIVGSKQASVEYSAKTTPSSALTYSSIADMEAVECPTVGVGQYCYTNGQTYKFTSNEEWVQDSNTFVKHFKDDGTVGVLPCGFNNNVLDVGILGNKQGTTPSYDPTLEVVIGDCVTSIGEGALYGLKNMSACTISSGVTSIGSNAFENCSSLTSINIPSGVTSISSFAFNNCSSLTSCTIGSGVTSIGNSAFYNCRSLTSVDIPNSVTSIGNNAFYNCTSLSSITIPSTVITINNGAFSNTPWWNSYSADTNNRYGNMVYINDIAYKATATNVTSVSFREGTVSIGGGAFSGCTRLNSIDIPNSVTSIGDTAFNGCSGLTSIDIPDSVTSIGNWVFYNCRRLTSIDIPSGVTSIGNYAFNNCRSLTSVTMYATTPPNLGDNVFGGTNNCPIYVPAASVDTYKAATNWSTYSSRIQAIPNS